MLFSHFDMAGIVLSNRIVMPPMTRARAAKGGIPTELMAEYYAQRASAGLIITEGSQISQQGQGYAWTPGIYSSQQIAGWKRVTEKVKAAGGKMFIQLWHVGRVSHTSLQVNGGAPVSSSAIQVDDVNVFIDPYNKGPVSGQGKMVQHSMPRALTTKEIQLIVNDYKKAAENAMTAGFDGVELHAANGYLINQFIDSQANLRTDEYGGSLVNRLRLLKEVTQAVGSVVGFKKVGVRLAPLTTLQGTVDDNPVATYLAAAKLLDSLGVSYIHIAEADWEDAPAMPAAFKEALRMIFSGTIIYAGKYTLDKANIALANNWADLIAFGRPFVANADLVKKLEFGYSLNVPDAEKFFGGSEQGYTDYSTF